MAKLESAPTINYVSIPIPAKTEVGVVVAYKIGKICTDSLPLGRTTLKIDTPVWVVGLPNQKRTRPMICELDSPECQALRRQGLYKQAREVQTTIAKKFIEDRPALFRIARRLTRRRALRKPMEIDDITNLQLEVQLD